ncbi:MAG: GGDEF domain-containing protein [Pseudomonadota bacterium]
MISLISTDVLAIIALCFTIGLAKRNVVVNNEKNKIYITVSLTTITLLILEIATVIMELSSDSKLIVPYRIANILGFSLSPVVPYIIFLFFNDNRKKSTLYRCFLAMPLCLNAIICVLSYKMGLVFFVDAQNQYARGSLFILPTLVSMLYYVLFVLAIFKNSVEYEAEEKKVVFSVFLIPVFAIILQIINREVILIWSCTAISLLLYYIFLLELQFKYDAQTKVRNRAAFEKEMEKYINGENNASIVMFDLNNLKVTNDKYGHKAGDEMIYQAARAIEESFMGIGKVFRIGGDEFCVICREIEKEPVGTALANLDILLAGINNNRQIKVILAYGQAYYSKEGNETIYSTFSRADKAMYTNKAKLKGLYGRRRSD